MMPIPYNISFNDWVCFTKMSTKRLNVPLPRPVDQWREWVSDLQQANNNNAIPLADKFQYPNEEDWRKWASFFYNNFSTYNS